MTTTAFSKMDIWLVTFCFLAASCGGQPVIEVVQLNLENVTELLTIEDKQSISVNDTKNELTTNQGSVRTEETPSAFVFFVDIPRHTETQLGSSILLACRTANPVVECQWSWQPLPPVHLPLPDNSDSSTESTATATSSVSQTPGPTAHPLPVRRFPAFGNNSNDCSVRFSSTKHEQIGYWTCAARNSMNDPFTNTEPAKLTIINDQQGSPDIFIKQVEAIEVVTGSSAQIPCETKLPIRECQWFWRRLNESQSSNLEIKKFAASAHNNTNCNIQFKNVLPEQEGYWTCGARIELNSSFLQSKPIRLLISEVEFVQLSRGVQVAAGESVLLRCLVNKPVMQCEWSWRATNSSKEPFLLKKFAPNKESNHDCSVRFKNILYDEEGLWTCGIRLSSEGILHEAPPTTVSLLPSSKVNLVEMPSNTTVPLGTEVTLKCITSSRVEKCTWSWKPLQCNSPEIVMHEFPSNGDLGRDCSLTLPHVRADEQGQWSCQVSISSLNTVLSSPFARLVTFEQDEVKFSELSKDIQISSGGTILLRCVTSTPVEQCRWSLTPVNSNTTVVVKQFPAAGNEARDCSVRLSHALAEQEGLWTCGARAHGRQNYTDAPPAKLSLLEPEPVSVVLWAAPHQKVTLACRVRPVSPKVQCHWLHAPNVHIHQSTTNTTKKSRHNLQMDYFTGICTIEFKPDHTDLGQWTCRFILQEKNAEMELGSTTLVLFNTQADQKLGWIVGSLTAVILFLMIIVVILVVCKNRFFTSKSLKMLETLPSSQKRHHNENSNKPEIQVSESESCNGISTM